MIKPIHAGALPISFAMARLAHIQETIDQRVQWREDNTKVSPGFLIESLVAAIMSTHGTIPLVRLQEYWRDQDWELLFRHTSITPDHLNDDAYGRALDKLADLDLEQLCMDISVQLLLKHKEDIQVIHADTTSKSVQGVYDQPADDSFVLAHGYSKDHRPDLKQLKIGLGVQQKGLPLFAQVFSGNVSDQKWSIQAIQKMSQVFEENGQRAPFVLDSSLITKDNLAAMEQKQIQFLSRIPDTFSVTESAKEEAMRSTEWSAFQTPNEKEYRLYTTFGVPCAQRKTMYPLTVVWSKELATKKEGTLQKNWAKMQKKLMKELKKKEKPLFSCGADARTALDESIRAIYEQGFDVKGTVTSVKTFSHTGPGRPKKDRVAEEMTTYALSFSDLAIHPAFAERERHMASCFVLISSPDMTHSAEEKLLLYKKQSRVETRFRLLKDPMVFHRVYLKNPTRVMALSYVFYLVLLLLSYLEYRVRRSLAERQEDWIAPGNKKTKTPSVKAIVETLDRLMTMAIGNDRYIAEPTRPQIHHAVDWAGFDLAILITPIIEMEQHIR
ncbi:IS1634 family transposase [Marinilactibacillus sp. Marseille-P9653]|uniref:IS1634 family transposase n=1 Tax=Marinilactibacillus sp. Marseille-P9653 TaxID=2866583 RepID=UPI001CE3DB3C|nr:IS1634 family transposase [Marinilactibacillus sp. Marseille-P9653]